MTAPAGVTVYRIDVEQDLTDLRPYDRLVIDHPGGRVEVVVGLVYKAEGD